MKKFTVIMILAIIATINAWYLSCKAFGFFSGKAFCDINSTRSCANVVNHPAAFIGPIPFPMIALVVYPIIFILALMGSGSSNKKKYYTILSRLSAAGILFNSYFIAQEAFVIKAFCPLCLLCTGVIITILILSLLGRRKWQAL
jgi:uncharacterized membrane protein